MPRDVTRNDLVPVSRPLADFTLAALQSQEDFILGQGPIQVVDPREGRYFTYDTGAWNRDEMQPRGPGEESTGGGWTISTDTYFPKKYASHIDNNWDDIAESEEAIDLEEDASDWLANQIAIKGDRLFATLFAAAQWTTDYDGVSGTPSASEFQQWNEASTDPQADVEVLKNAIRGLVSKGANFIVCGEDVHTELLTHPILRDSVKHTGRTDSNVMRDAIKSWFGVDNYLVARGLYNSAAQGQTAVMANILTADDFFIGYVDPAPGLKKMTAFKSFVWNGPRDAGSQGIVAKTFDLEAREVTRHEVNYYVDVKKVAADAGAFIDAAVA